MKSLVTDGKSALVGCDRSLVLDVLHVAKHVPSYPVERWFDLNDVSRARENAPTRISWVALFAKAYGLASCRVNQLRHFYLPYPVPHIFQTPGSVITVTISRNFEGCDRLFWGRLHFPETKSLVEIQSQLDQYTSGDPAIVFKQQVLSARMPAFIRRLGWWWRLYASPKQRARRMGTGSISVLASQGVTNRLHPCILTSSLDYGPLERDGKMWVTLQCDHRLIDGTVAARAINEIHSALCQEVLTELRAMLTLAGWSVDGKNASNGNTNRSRCG